MHPVESYSCTGFLRKSPLKFIPVLFYRGHGENHGHVFHITINDFDIKSLQGSHKTKKTTFYDRLYSVYHSITSQCPPLDEPTNLILSDALIILCKVLMDIPSFSDISFRVVLLLFLMILIILSSLDSFFQVPF